MTGRTADGRIETVRIVPDGSAVANYAFDVTPARLVTGLITERGVIAADRGGAGGAFAERAAAAVSGIGKHVIGQRGDAGFDAVTRVLRA